MVTYNHAFIIERAVRSVLEQTGDFDLEVIVGDDASTDGTSEILRGLAEQDHRLRVFTHPQNRGVLANWRFISEQARGQFIAICDGDDLMLPGKLDAQVRFLREHPKCFAVFHGMEIRALDGEIQEANDESDIPTEFALDELLRRGNFLFHSSKLMRAYNGFAADIPERVLAFPDFETYVRGSKQGKFGYIPEKLGVYHRGMPGSMSGWLARDPAGYGNDMIELYERSGCIGQQGVRERLARLLFEFSLVALNLGKKSDFQYLIGRALDYDPQSTKLRTIRRLAKWRLSLIIFMATRIYGGARRWGARLKQVRSDV